MADLLWNLQAVYLAGRHLPRLADVTVQIEQGITAVVGCSGAGKTSLLNLLVGFEKPEGGAISRSLPAEGRVLPLYWVPQGAGLWPHLTVQQHLATVAGADASGQAMADMLGSFDLRDKSSSFPAQLSMGERSRLAVARALLAGAAVLVMDEPLAHVDEARAGRYWEVVREHVAASDASLVFATHSPKLVVGHAERVICLKEGRVVYAGGVDELYWDPPGREQAECLGEVNWFEPGEAGRWFENGAPARRCYRPQQVQVLKSPAGPLLVQSSRFKGSVAAVDLLDEGTGRARRFYHCPGADDLRKGDHVILKALVLLLCVLLIGCGGAPEPPLAVREVHSWHMPADGPSIPAPRAVAIGRADEVYVLDTAGRVLVFSPDGKLTRQWRMPAWDVGTAEGVCVLKDGRIAVSDTHYSQVVIFEPDGTVAKRFGRYGTGPGEFLYPVGIAQDDHGDLYVAEYGSNDRVQKFTADGEFLLSFGTFGTGPGQFQRPSGVVWHEGRVLVADAINNRIQVFSDGGEFLGVLGAAGAGIPLHFPYDIAMAPDGGLYVVEYGAGRVTRLSLDGRLLGRYGRTGTGEGQFRTPWGLAVDSKMRLRIADTGNRRIVDLRL